MNTLSVDFIGVKAIIHNKITIITTTIIATVTQFTIDATTTTICVYITTVVILVVVDNKRVITPITVRGS